MAYLDVVRRVRIVQATPRAAPPDSSSVFPLSRLPRMSGPQAETGFVQFLSMNRDSSRLSGTAGEKLVLVL